MTLAFELRPDRLLLNPNFNGYKLSLEKIPLLRKDLDYLVDRVRPNLEQYSLLHAKLFGLHNHLYADRIDNSVYFIDKSWNVQKISMNSATGRLNDIKSVWQIPNRDKRIPGSYNTSLHFTTETLALLTDGSGTLYVLNTGKRADSNKWESIFAEEVLQPSTNFIIQDAVCKSNDSGQNEIHCLLIYVDRNKDNDKFSTIINWITLKENSNAHWDQVSLRVLQASGGFYHCALEPNCKFIYIASDKQFQFTLDSENPLVENSDKKKQSVSKIYTWIQTEDDIIVRFNVEANCNQSDFVIDTQVSKIHIRYKNATLVDGNLSHRIDPNLSTWIINNDILEVTLVKSECSLKWQEFIPGDETGEQIFDPDIVADVHSKLSHLCSEIEVIPAGSGPTFSSHQMEECDFDSEKTAIFERISVDTHSVTHRTNLGSHQVLMSVKLHANLPSVLAIRHDVDACLWSPQEQSDGKWILKHEGTLFAFGYVQASKQQRKFSSCSPDLNYSVICESTRHVFIYQQNKVVTSGEIRNRISGHRIGTIAEQQVVNLGDDEILGLSATNEVLYLLTENCIFALKIKCTEE